MQLSSTPGDRRSVRDDAPLARSCHRRRAVTDALNGGVVRFFAVISPALLAALVSLSLPARDQAKPASGSRPR